MERPNPVVVLACLVLVTSMGVVPALAGPAGPPGTPAEAAATTPPSPTNNTTSRLTLPRYRIEQSEFETVRIGIGSALQTSSDGVRFQHQRATVRREFEAADSQSERLAVIDQALIEFRSRSETLEAREREAIRNYSDGNVSAGTLVRRLARIDADARRIDAMMGELQRLADRTQDDRFDSPIRDIRGRVKPLQGPVRQRAHQALAAESSPVRISVTASDEGVVLSALSGGEYHREATYWWNRNESGDQELTTIRDVRTRAGELYPWVVSTRGQTSVDWYGEGVWQWGARHPQGTIDVYIDASTRDVFRETQTLDVDDMPTTMTIERERDGLRVNLGRTYVGGPLSVLVEDAQTDAAVNANVSVGGYDVGSTGADGLVTTIEPHPPYEVTVTVDGTPVTVTVERPFGESEG